jgi:hypothetical protein
MANGDYLFQAPLLKEVDVKYGYKHFNGSFMRQTVFRKLGSPEVDAAWETLGVDCESANTSF